MAVLVSREEIEAQRLAAAQAEWERQDRVRRVLLVSLELQIQRATKLGTQYVGGLPAVDELIDALRGIRDILSGQWIKSPQAMAAQRAAGESDAARQ